MAPFSRKREHIEVPKHHLGIFSILKKKLISLALRVNVVHQSDKELSVKRLSLLVILFFSLSCTKKNNPASSDSMFQEYNLTNGLHLIMIKNKKAPATEIYHWVKAGSLHESKGSTGIAHLFEHMMFRPLKKGQPSFSEKLKNYGVQKNASTRFESTVYTTTTPQEYLKQVLEIESERFKKLKVNDELLDIEREAVRSEYSTKMDSNPVIDLWETIYRKGYNDHPYQWMIIGERKDLDKITAKQANDFFEKFYRPNNTGLIISGDIEFSETKSWVEEFYGDWKNKPVSHSIPQVPMSPGFVQAVGNLSANSRNVMIGHRVPQPTSENFMLLELFNFIFYGSDYSLGDRVLVAKKKLASSISPFNFRYDNGMVKCFLQLLPNASLKSVIDEINKFPEIVKNMSEEEFNAYWNKFSLDVIESLQRNDQLAYITAISWGKYNYSQAFINPKKSLISKAKLLDFMGTYITKDNMVVVTNKNFKGPKK